MNNCIAVVSGQTTGKIIAGAAFYCLCLTITLFLSPCVVVNSAQPEMNGRRIPCLIFHEPQERL